jgi:hypothetical protein
LWWDLTRGRGFTNPAPAALPVVAEGVLDRLQRAGLFGVAPGVKDAGGPIYTGFVRAMHIADLLLAAKRVQIGLAAVPTQLPSTEVGINVLDTESPPPLFGVIDDGCAFLNKCFATDPEIPHSESRVKWLWDQDGEARLAAHPKWWTPTTFGYGAQLTSTGFAEARRVADGHGEPQGYRAIGYLSDRTGSLPLHSHGTGVTGLAAGAIDRLLEWCGTGVGGEANKVRICAVALPAAVIADTSGRSLVFHLLNGIHYILARAQRTQDVVINISLGQYGGPHDGTSMLESAIQKLVKTRWSKDQRLVVTLGAGNGYRSATHGQADVPALGHKDFDWLLPASDPTDSFLEVWPSEAELKIEVRDPSTGLSGDIDIGQAAVLWRQGTPVACVSNLERTALGATPLIHVAVAPTRPLDGLVGADSGVWHVRVIAKNSECAFDAWVDRDDAPLGAIYRPRPQSRLVGDIVQSEGTISGLAEPGWTAVAGAYVLKSGELSDYSASGDGRGGDWRRPWLAMPGDESPAVAGLPCPGVVSGRIDRLSGTSVASALLARELINFLRGNSGVRKWSDLRDEFLAHILQQLRPPEPDLRSGLGMADASICKRP